MNKMKALLLGLTLPLLLLADVAPEAPLGLRFVPEAGAIIGLPFTPLSFAGVARRTTRRVVYTESAVAASSAAAASAAAASSAATASAAAAAKPVAPSLGSTIMVLPAGCVATPINGIEYYNCGPGIYYRTAFQGSNLVYVATQP